MSYQITITKLSDVQTMKKGAWTVIDKVPWGEKTLSQAEIYGSTENFLNRNPLREVLGYAPDVSTTITKETEVLKQTVSDLDLTAVIKAINSIK